MTAADVKKVAAKYLDVQSSVTGYLLPRRPEDDETKDAKKPAEARQ